MKKLLVLTSLLLSHAVQASNPEFFSFLGTGQNSAQQNDKLKNTDYLSVQITNGVNYSTFNVPGFFGNVSNEVYYAVGNNYPSFISISTPLIAYSTNYIGGQTNGTIGATTGFTNVTQVGGQLASYNPYGFQLYGTNMYLVQNTSGVAQVAGNTTGGPFIPITIPNADANGVINTNVLFVFGFAGDNNACTNATNRITLYKSYDGNVYDTVNTNTGVINATLNGTNEVLAVYQPSATWMVGVRSVAIGAIFCGTNTSSTNTYLTKAGCQIAVP